MLLPVSLLVAASAVVSPALGNPTSHTAHKSHDQVIERDVIVLGGGGTGAYAAVQLQDRNHSVIVVEKKARLGGHAETAYFQTGIVDYGVTDYFNNTLTRNFFSRLDVQSTGLRGIIKNDNVNFKTGKMVQIPPMPALPQLISLYMNAINNFNYTMTGLYDFPKPIPEELLQPFGDFIKTHPELEVALPMVYSFAAGVGNLLETPLLYVLQTIAKVHIVNLPLGIIRPVNGVASLFDRAAQVIGEENILFESTAHKVVRDADGVTMTVRTSTGCGGAHTTTVIKAKKLLVAIPPNMPNMKPFDLDASEKALFDKFSWNNYYVAVVADSGIPDTLQVSNLNPSEPMNIPVPPVQWSLQYLGANGTTASKVVGDKHFTAEQAKKLILSDIHRMNGTYPIKDPKIVNFGAHTPLGMNVPVDEIRNGFYDKLYGLQGQRNTFYTGNTFCTDYSSILWNYTESVMDKMFP